MIVKHIEMKLLVLVLNQNSISAGVRPVISLKYGQKFYNGDGTTTNPYKVYGDG